jgi:tRNA (guanine9-N1)-methyltransferase
VRTPLSQAQAAMSEEELAALAARRAAGREAREQQKAAQAANRAAALTSAHTLVIDCAFEPLMEPREVKSMVHQFTQCYAANTRAQVPARLCLTGLGGSLAAGLSAVCGADSWPVRATQAPLHAHACCHARRRLTRARPHPHAQLVRDARSYLDVFAERRERLVYLTADSPHELEALSPDDIYIVGGIVDRNRHKARARGARRCAPASGTRADALPRRRVAAQNLTLDKATAEGIRHARLPIQQHMKLAGSHVLTVNQVVDLLLAWLALRDWRAACERAVPKRKQMEGEAQDVAPASRKARRTAAAAEKGEPADDAADDEDDAPEGGEAAAAEEPAPAAV